MQIIQILNLKCNGCANTIKKGLLSIPEVTTVTITLENSQININPVSEEILSLVKQKLANMGYPEVGDANTFLHKAKSFVSCASGRIGK